MPDYPCPRCNKSFDMSDMPWKCPKCAHVDQHWNPTFNCEKCGFNPDDSTDMHCPLCGQAMNIMAIFFNKKPTTSSARREPGGQRHLRDFLASDNILISPEIQNAPLFPFTIERARRFFAVFQDEGFDFAAEVKAIVINSGKENLPSHSFATGFLFSQSLDELEKLRGFPKPVGSIHMECGGNTKKPVIKTHPM